MSNPEVLNSRLKLLQSDVSVLIDRLTRLTEDVKEFDGLPQADLLLKQAADQGQAINNLLGNITQSASPADWSAYNDVRDQVAQINQEVLEIVQGLAIHREKEIAHEKFCRIVRGFLRGIFDRYGAPPGLTVFTARELYVPTLARLTRVRYPVESIWTLPFAAHQFAYLKIKDNEQLAGLAKDLAVREVQTLLPPVPEASRQPGASRIGDAARRRAEAKAQSRWIQIMSDALGVYFTGPCYAGTAILMRLSPAGAEPDDDSQAPEIDRAFVILEMLRQMDLKGEAAKGPYSDFVSWLDNQWKEMLTAAGSEGLAEERQRELQAFVKSLMKSADSTLSFGKYPIHIEQFKGGSWNTAQQWSTNWLEDLKNTDDLRLPANVSILSTVRDAFNAGWLCRSITEDISRMDVIAAAVLKLCDQIFEEVNQQSQAPPPGMQGPAGARAQYGGRQF